MTYHKIFSAIGFLLISALVGVAQEPADTKEQLKKLQEERNAVADEYNSRIRKIRESAELKKLDEQIKAAVKAVRDFERNDDSVAKARQAEQEALAKYQREIEKELAKHAKVGPLVTKLKNLRDEIDVHSYEIELARFKLEHKLSPINRALTQDEKLKSLREQAELAIGADRQRLLKEHAELLQMKRKEHELAKPLFETIDQHKAEIQSLASQERELQAQITPIRKEIEAKKREILTEAAQALKDAVNSVQLQKLRTEHAEAIEAYNAKAKELLEENAKIQELKSRYDELGTKIRELRK